MIWKEFLDQERDQTWGGDIDVDTNVKYRCCQRELHSQCSNIKLYLLGIWKSLDVLGIVTYTPTMDKEATIKNIKLAI